MYHWAAWVARGMFVLLRNEALHDIVIERIQGEKKVYKALLYYFSIGIKL